MKLIRHVLILIVLLTSFLISQPKVVSLEELPLGMNQPWQNARFSPSGNALYYTAAGFRGIWKYSLQDNTVEQITDEPGAGYGFSVSADESKITYKTTRTLPSRRREYTIVLQDLNTRSVSVVDSGRRLSAPTFAGQGIRYTKGARSEQYKLEMAESNVQILATDDANIALLKGSERVILDPLGTGRYIWPSLSPDRRLLVANQMEQGTFVFDLDGNVVSRLGRRNAPAWTHDGKWIAYMDDRDDGHRILSSDIMLVSHDGKTTVALTETPDIIELFPSCSPTERKIAFNTLDGRIFILTYSE